MSKSTRTKATYIGLTLCFVETVK